MFSNKKFLPSSALAPGCRVVHSCTASDMMFFLGVLSNNPTLLSLPARIFPSVVTPAICLPIQPMLSTRKFGSIVSTNPCVWMMALYLLIASCAPFVPVNAAAATLFPVASAICLPIRLCVLPANSSGSNTACPAKSPICPPTVSCPRIITSLVTSVISLPISTCWRM